MHDLTEAVKHELIFIRNVDGKDLDFCPLLVQSGADYTEELGK